MMSEDFPDYISVIDQEFHFYGFSSYSRAYVALEYRKNRVKEQKHIPNGILSPCAEILNFSA